MRLKIPARLKSAPVGVWLWPLGVYAALALAVLLPLVKPGFIFALDMVFGPSLKLPAEPTSSYLFYAVLHVLNFALPADVIQKIILLAVLVLSGLGAHRMAAYFAAAPQQHAARLAPWACYMAGVLYMINPYVYGRFMAGQFAVLLGYALLPWFIRSLWIAMYRPTFTQTLRVAGWVITISIVSVHTLGLAAIIAAAAAGLAVWRYRHNKAVLLALAKHAGLALGVVLLASSYWLLPALLGHGGLAQNVNSFDAAHRQAFATVPGQLGVELNVLAMQGFWAEATDLFVLPQDISNWWLLWLLLLWTVVIVGAIKAWRMQWGAAIFFISIGVAGWLLALGSADNAAAPLNEWLARHVPFFAGYREPHKFTGLLVLSYVYCATFGVWAIGNRARRLLHVGKIVTPLIIGGLLLVPLAYAHLMLWGFNGQFATRQYPADWYAINKYLNGQPGEFKVLFLPWHLYTRYEFAGRIIASPATKFFDRPMVVSSNPELGDIAAEPNRNTGTLLEPYVLPDGNRHHQLARELARHNIRYILLTKESDYKDYGYIFQDSNIKLLNQTEHFWLFVIKL